MRAYKLHAQAIGGRELELRLISEDPYNRCLGARAEIRGRVPEWCLPAL